MIMIWQIFLFIVESYSLANHQWVSRPSLNQKKGSLAGVSLNNTIFAIGGGNGVECFSEVEMFELDAGRWIQTPSMRHEVFFCPSNIASQMLGEDLKLQLIKKVVDAV